MDCVTHKPPRNRYHTAMAIALTLLLQDLWYEPSLRGWDSAAELVCYYQLDPQNRHSHPLSLELSLSQPLSWMAPRCHFKCQLLDPESIRTDCKPQCLSKRSWYFCPFASAALSSSHRGHWHLWGPWAAG